MEIRLDYATFNFDRDTMTLEQVQKTLVGDANLCFCRKSLSDNAIAVSPYGLSWLENSGCYNRPHRLQVSGLGCDKFGLVLPRLVTEAARNYGTVSFSRLDFAFDVLMPQQKWHDFIVKAFQSSLDSDRDLKRYTVSGSGEAMTIYIGSRTSPRFFRIYNKTLEDKHYVFTENGMNIEVPENTYVIRYEIELKRKLWNREGAKVVVDPTPWFKAYYDGSQELIDYVRDLWLSFGDDVLLPDGFADAKLTLRSKSFYFASKDADAESIVDLTVDRVQSLPHSWDYVVDYVSSRFAKYIPWIIADRDKMQGCLRACKSFCGFVPPLSADNLIFTGLSEIPDDDIDDIYDPWSTNDFVATQIDLFMEGGGDFGN